MSSEGERRGRFEAVAAEVFDPLQRYLLRRARPDEAEEVFGDVLLTIWRKLDDLPEEAVLPWSYGVARRVLANHRRASARRLRLMERLESEPLPAGPDDPSEISPDPALAAAMAALPPADQEVLRLWAWEQLEPREIARVLGTTPNAISLRLSRAKKKLARSLERQDRQESGQRVDGTTEEHQR